jgi:hypothetical protein
MRQDADTRAALAYLSRHLIRKSPANQFASALNIQHPDVRWLKTTLFLQPNLIRPLASFIR